MPGLAPPKAAAGVNPKAGGPSAGGPGRAIALASVAPSAMASGSCASRAELAQTWAPLTELISHHSNRYSQANKRLVGNFYITDALGTERLVRPWRRIDITLSYTQATC